MYHNAVRCKHAIVLSLFRKHRNMCLPRAWNYVPSAKRELSCLPRAWNACSVVMYCKVITTCVKLCALRASATAELCAPCSFHKREIVYRVSVFLASGLCVKFLLSSC